MKPWSRILFLLLFAAVPATAQDKPGYKIEPVKDNVYMFSAGHYRSAFMVTDEGIVVTDPCGKEAAAWLKAELAKRFNQPIRYVIYSHSHPDHAYGGEAFDGPDVTFISHRLARENWLMTKAKVRMPTIVFDDELTLYLGGSEVTLRYHGVNNGRGSISMLFGPAKLLHVVDWIVVGRMPYKDLQGYDIEGMIASTREVLAYDFDAFIGGHAEAGNKDDVRRYLSYIESLYTQVRDGMLAGKDLPTLQKDITLEEFKDLPRFNEWRATNIEGVYHNLRDQSYLLMRPDVPKPRDGQ